MRSSRGFSLIELMIAVGIIGILAAIAIPSWNDYKRKAVRSSAQQFMMDVASREKQYLLDRRQYLAIADNSGFSALDGLVLPTDVSTHYNMSVTVLGNSFTVTASAASAQQTLDGSLTLTSAGAKTWTLPDLTVKSW